MRVSHVVPTPSSTIEAYLLLEAARADWQVWLTRQNLVHQIIHRNTLMLQYNNLMLEKAQDELHAADHFVGQVHTTIRWSGITTAFEYAMREDHSSVAISGEVHPSRFPFVWFKFIARLASIIVTWCNVRLVLLLYCLMFYSAMHLLYCEISAPYIRSLTGCLFHTYFELSCISCSTFLSLYSPVKWAKEVFQL